MDRNPMETHDKAVSAISSRIQSFSKTKTPFRLYHGSTNSTQHRKVDRNRMVDTSKLNHVLEIDKTNKTCLVEPNVAMDELVDAVMKAELLPPVVMEFPGITVGGGFAGTAGESSGFKYGFFDRTINWIEIVLPTGEVVTASPHEREDLFYGAAGSFGTLGVATLFEIQLIDLKSHVELSYHPVGSVSEALTTMSNATKFESNDYVDGILFAKDRGVIITGTLVDKPGPEKKEQTFSKDSDPWFYLHVDEIGSRNLETVKEIVPIRDYLFRYDRGAFWTGKYAFSYFLVPFNHITRRLIDYFMHTRVMYHALHASGHASKYMIQDLLIPSHNAKTFIDYVDSTFGLWPLWLCPIKKGEQVALHPQLDEGDFVNVGVWGPGPTDYRRFVGVNRDLERKVRLLGGVKWLYAQAYYTEDEFWSIYDKKWYDSLREKYGAEYLPSVYEKVNVDLTKVGQEKATWSGWVWGVWPVSGVYGVLKTLYEREYLLAR